MLDVVRLGPGDDATDVTAAQLRGVIDRLIETGQQQDPDPDILVVMDAGYDVVRLAWLLQDLPVILVGRLRSDRVFHAPAGARRGPTKGRQPRHGSKLVLRDPSTHPVPVCSSRHDLERYGRTGAVALPTCTPKSIPAEASRTIRAPCPWSKEPSSV